VLFAVIDPIGAIPIVISLRDRGKTIKSGKAVIYAFCLLFIFFFVGDALLRLIGVDINSFAVAGALVLFFLALEMVLDIVIFKDTAVAGNDATYVPVVFPLLAGAGSFTTLLSLKAEYSSINILAALFTNALVVLLVLLTTKRLSRILGKAGLYFIRKFFGIIILAISVRLFTSNLSYLIESISNN
jgi:multiple antibiotic resistance protein